jgi:hypothetical protein
MPFHSHIRMVCRSDQVLVTYDEGAEEGAVQWWLAPRSLQHQLEAEEGAVQWWLAPLTLIHFLEKVVYDCPIIALKRCITAST